MAKIMSATDPGMMMNKKDMMRGSLKHPLLSMTPQMMSSIKSSPKGKLPAGLAKYLKKKGK